MNKTSHLVGNPRGKTAQEKLDFYGWAVTEYGCWEWNGPLLANGYGRLWLNGKSVKTHRLVYELQVGPIPEGMLVRHKCDNPPCINPEHLELGTPADNMYDKVTRNRQYRPSSEKSPGTKLRPEQVISIREEYAMGGCSYEALGLRYSVTLSNIGFIIQRKTWRNI